MGISENIKRRRLELNLSQQELANAIGYKSRSTIAKIEAGENDIPKSKIPKFARALDTTVDYIMTGAGGTGAYCASGQTKGFEGSNRYSGQAEDSEGFYSVAAQEEGGARHKNVVIVLAGGKSSRNMQNIPNQFISVLGKPVIIYCLEAYQRHPAIDDIYVVCIKDWEGILDAYCRQYSINKLRGIIPAGETGILSVYNGIERIRGRYDRNDIIILQEATRPLVTEEMISKLLNACIRRGGAIACEPMGEYIQFELSGEEIEENNHSRYLNRHRIVNIQSPEAYRLGTILEVFRTAQDRGHQLDETCFGMLQYNLGNELQFYEGNHYNIKVVRQEDIAILSALLRSRQ